MGPKNIQTASLQRDRTSHTNVLDMILKESVEEAPVMPEPLGMLSTSSLILLSGSLWPRVVAPNRVISIGQIDLNCVLMLNLIA